MSALIAPIMRVAKVLPDDALLALHADVVAMVVDRGLIALGGLPKEATPKKKWTGKASKLHWAKRIDGWKADAKNAYGVAGFFCNDPNEEKEGQWILLKDGDTYMVVVREDAMRWKWGDKMVKASLRAKGSFADCHAKMVAMGRVC